MATDLWHFFLDDIGNKQQKIYLDFFPSVSNRSTAKILRKHAENLLQLSLFPDFGTTASIIASICSLFRLFCDTTQYHISFMHLNAKADYLLFCRIAHVLEEKNGRISRQELQEFFHYTPDYLARIVKKYSGKNLFDFSMDFCLAKAASLIIHTDKPITRISEELGFTNRYHFYKIFRVKYGMTPNEYRKAHK